MSDQQAYDYIIIGAGTAGCVLANRLIRRPGQIRCCCSRRAVNATTTSGSTSPSATSTPSAIPRTDWCFETEPDPGLNGRSIGYARGKVLGGCSSINAMIYMRGQQSDYDHWAQLGNRGWSWDEVLPVFKASKDYQHGADAFHGERRRAPGGGAPGELGNPRCLAGRRRGVRHPQDHRVQPRRQLRQRLLPDEPEARRALVRQQGLPAIRPQDRPNLTVRTESAGVQKLAAQETDGPGSHGHWPWRPRPFGGTETLTGPARGAAGRWFHRLTAAPAALGHRPRRTAASSAASPCTPRICPG